MDERVVQFRVGVMVLATFIIAGILVLLFGELPSFVKPTYTVYVKFAQAPGVAKETPVRKSGILIGRVTDVGFTDDGGVLVTIELRSDVQINRNEFPRIANSLLGDAEIQFVPIKDEAAAKIPLKDGDVLEGEVASDPLRMLGNLEGRLNTAITSLSNAGDEVGQLARNLNQTLTDNRDQIDRIVDKTEKALETVQLAMEDLDSVLGDKQLQDNIKQGIAELPGLMRETSEAVQGIQNTLDLADRNLRNLEGFTRPLGERGEELVLKVDSSIGRLDELLAQLVDFSGRLNSEEGSLGQLINNPDVYQQLNEAAMNINQLTRELQPIVRDARVFTDKIARHPEVLGARGAIRPSSGIK